MCIRDSFIIGLVMILTGCGSSDEEEARTPPNAESNPANPTPSPEASALEGTWRTKAISVEDMTRTVREQGLAKWVDRFAQNAPISETPTSLILEIGDGAWDLYGQAQGARREEIDYDAQVEVDGNTVAASHEGDSNTYRWSVRGDVLELTWLKTTYGRNEGVPEEVFQRALYMTTNFRRTP